MRSNLPITNNEVFLTDKHQIVSKTDLKGTITYINRDFLTISGFSESELIGKPHNIVRHPDMPEEAFQDMWNFLKDGRPWVGYVKNRCKNGDFYWVEAHTAPIWENNQIVGYMSVRNKPEIEKIKTFESAYRLFKENKNHGLKIYAGEGVKNSFFTKIKQSIKDLSVGKKIFSGFGIILGLSSILSCISIYQFISVQNQYNYLNDVVVKKENLVSDNSILLGKAVHSFKNYVIRQKLDYKDSFDQSINLLDNIDVEYKKIDNNLTSEEIKLLLEIKKNTNNYKESIQKITKAIENKLSINEIDSSVKGADKPIEKSLLELTKINKQKLKNYNEQLKDNIDVAIKTSLLFLASILFLGILFSFVITLAITGSIESILLAFRRLSAGFYDNKISVNSNDDIGRILQGLEVMQNRLGFEQAESKKNYEEILRIKMSLDASTTPTTISDDRNILIYMNPAAECLWKSIESKMKQKIPSFSVDNMKNHSLVDFFDDENAKNVYRQKLEKPLTMQIDMCSKILKVTATPIYTSDKFYIGRASQWIDRTAEIEIEKNIELLVDNAANGNFDGRMNIEGKEDFFKNLGNGLNRLMISTQNSLNEFALVLSALSEGRLTKTMNGNYSGVFEELSINVNLTVNKLKDIVSNIKESAEAINTASKEIAAGNQDLSSRTEEQASSLEETASSMEELNSTVKQNTANSLHAKDLANVSQQQARDGQKLVENVVSTMSEIQQSSKKIGDIISVIDSIAFQTNILALNAAVEAARAGEQGRGFAVVATEVRALAGRSAQAAKEIKNLIEQSINSVEKGSSLVNRTGDSIRNVVASFDSVANLVSDITNASNEQSCGIDQVTLAVTQMDEVTQQNAALVEEAAAAAMSLSEQADNLVETVSHFIVDEYSKPVKKNKEYQTKNSFSKNNISKNQLGKKNKIIDDEWEEF